RDDGWSQSHPALGARTRLRHEVRIAANLKAALLDRHGPELHEIIKLTLRGAFVEIATEDLQGILKITRHGVSEGKVLASSDVRAARRGDWRELCDRLLRRPGNGQ